jgi:hypothetical protein
MGLILIQRLQRRTTSMYGAAVASGDSNETSQSSLHPQSSKMFCPLMWSTDDIHSVEESWPYNGKNSTSLLSRDCRPSSMADTLSPSSDLILTAMLEDSCFVCQMVFFSAGTALYGWQGSVLCSWPRHGACSDNPIMKADALSISCEPISLYKFCATHLVLWGLSHRHATPALLKRYSRMLQLQRTHKQTQSDMQLIKTS